jgi:hypothetical protein
MILYIAAFVTLCEAYMGIEPHFDLWSQFFHVQLSQGAEAAILGGMNIYIKFKPGVNPYFCLPMSESMVPKCHSPCSWTAALSLNPTGSTKWLGGTSAGYNPYVR